MPALTDTVLSFVSNNADRLLLLVPLAIVFGLGWSDWRRHGAPAARRVCQAAGILVAGLLAWLVAAALMAVGGVDPLLWAPPLDRLLAVISVVALGWLWVQLPTPHRGRWHAFLALGFGLTLVAYLAWAPAWSSAWRADPTGAGDSLVVGLRRAWDLWFLVLAALLLFLLVARRGGQAPRWGLALAGCLVAGGLIEVLRPLTGTYLPAWARLGLFAAGGCVVAVGLRQALAAGADPGLTVDHEPVHADPIVAEAAVTAEVEEVAVGPGAPEAMPPAEAAGDAARAEVAADDAARAEVAAGTGVAEAPADSGAAAGIAAAGVAAAGGAEEGGDTAQAGQAEDLFQTLRLDIAMLAARMDRVEADREHGAQDGGPGAETALDGWPIDPTARICLAQALVPEIIEALQAPMNQIRAYRDLLMRGSGLRQEQVQRYVYRIEANLVRLQVMLDTLVAVLAVHGRAPATAAAPIQIPPVVRAAFDRVEPEIQEKGLALRLEIEDPLPAAAVDPQLTARIVDNLLVNASRRSPQGGEVTVRAAAERASPTGDLVISVHDWGARIGDDVIGAIELDSTDGADVPVDLKAVRFLAACQGGRLWAENRAAGAGFCVSLPGERLSEPDRPAAA